MKGLPMYVYAVIQHQDDDNEYDNSTVCLYTTEEMALAKARELNKEYGTTDYCKFDENWDFIDFTEKGMMVCQAHYYTVERERVYDNLEDTKLI